MSAVSSIPGRIVTMRRPLWMTATFMALVLTVYITRYEGGPLDILFTLAAPATFGALLLLLSRRPLFSVIATTLCVSLIFAVSKAKQEAMNMVLHAYDIIFYLSSWSTISFLLESYGRSVSLFGVGLAVTIGLMVLAWRADRDRVRRVHALGLAAGLAITTAVAAHLRAPLHEATFFTDDRYISQFFSSLSETAAVLVRGNLVEAAPAGGPGAPFARSAVCTPVAKPPHIILIHQESTVPPSNFPGLVYDHDIDPFFQSFDGKLRKLRVETYAGASWLSEFSILTGMSSHAFGSMRPYVQSIMAGKLRDSMPQFLEQCGYSNVLVYPMLRNFVANALFYEKIGLGKVIDARDQNAKRPNERDRFYYDTALGEIGRHRQEKPSQPMFMYIQTQASHAEYNFTYEPNETVSGGGTDLEVHEYLRRLGMAAKDYRYLKGELARRFPAERFLIVNYGDHHPHITRRLLGLDGQGTLSMERHPAAFETYYSLDGVGYKPIPLPEVDLMDVPYLSVAVLEAAGLPMPESYQERRRLMLVCYGRYHGCAQRKQILAFHRRLLNSNLIDRF